MAINVWWCSRTKRIFILPYWIGGLLINLGLIALFHYKELNKYHRYSLLIALNITTTFIIDSYLNSGLYDDNFFSAIRLRILVILLFSVLQGNWVLSFSKATFLPRDGSA